MSVFNERPVKNREVCELLEISDYKRKQLISRGILDEPIDTGGAYPEHTFSQVQRAKARLLEKSAPRQRTPGAKKTRPLSRKVAREIRGFR